jgi:hypothetical protein
MAIINGKRGPIRWRRGGNAVGTCLLGEIRMPYARLVELFGEPNKGDGYKTDAEWTLTIEGDHIATIYNWKDGPAYNGTAGTPVEKIDHWHVGGKRREALWLIQEMTDG